MESSNKPQALKGKDFVEAVSRLERGWTLVYDRVLKKYCLHEKDPCSLSGAWAFLADGLALKVIREMKMEKRRDRNGGELIEYEINTGAASV